ncbi:MAG: hypothetical protein ACRC33_26340 [Gemmataceae bacterium]
MTTEGAPAAALGETMVEKLKASPHPLTLKEAAKGVPKLKPKEKPAEVEARVRAALDAEVGTARLFTAPSGKAGAARYWGRDERHLLREKAVESAATPQPLAGLVKAVGKDATADPAFVDGLLRDLIGDGLLHEHEGGKKGPLFGASPPPPPVPLLERPANAKELAKVVKAVELLLKKVPATLPDVLAALAAHFTAPASAPPAPSPASPSASEGDIEGHILDAVEREGTMSLKELRHSMPAGSRGGAFDKAVLGLEDRGRVSLSRDFDSTHFGPEEQAEYVREGDILFTSIAKRS